MGGAAVRDALAMAQVPAAAPTALYVGNMMSGILSQQQHLGPLLANAAGLGPVETFTAEACCGSGGAALRLGYMAIASGQHDTVVVAGVEHMTHTPSAPLTAAYVVLALSLSLALSLALAWLADPPPARAARGQ